MLQLDAELDVSADVRTRPADHGQTRHARRAIAQPLSEPKQRRRSGLVKVLVGAAVPSTHVVFADGRELGVGRGPRVGQPGGWIVRARQHIPQAIARLLPACPRTDAPVIEGWET